MRRLGGLQFFIDLADGLRQRLRHGGTALRQFFIAAQGTGRQTAVRLRELDDAVDLGHHLVTLDLTFGLGNVLQGQAHVQALGDRDHHEGHKTLDQKLLGQAQTVQERHGMYRG